MNDPTASTGFQEGDSIDASKYTQEQISDNYVQEGVRAKAIWASESDDDDSWSDAVSTRNESMVPDSNIHSSVVAADLVMVEANNTTTESNDINVQTGVIASDPDVTESQAKLDDNMSETSKTLTDTTVVGGNFGSIVSEASACMSDYADFIAQESGNIQSEGSEDIAMMDAGAPESSVADDTVAMSNVIAPVLSKAESEPNLTFNHHIDVSDTDTITVNTIKAEPMSSSVNVLEENEEHANEELAIAEHRKEAAENWKPSHRKRHYMPHYRENFHGHIPTAGVTFWSQIKDNPREWLNYMKDDHAQQRQMVKDSVARKQKAAEVEKQKEAEAKKNILAMGGQPDFKEDSEEELSAGLTNFLGSKLKIKQEPRDDHSSSAFGGFKDSKVKIKQEPSN